MIVREALRFSMPDRELMTDAEFEEFRARLADFDPTVERCRRIVIVTAHETDGFDEPYMYLREATCVLPQGHRGACSDERPAIGWPGYRVLRALVDAHATLREEHLEQARLLGMSAERELGLPARYGWAPEYLR